MTYEVLVLILAIVAVGTLALAIIQASASGNVSAKSLIVKFIGFILSGTGTGWLLRQRKDARAEHAEAALLLEKYGC